jgi:hypothetical protein
MSFIREKDEYTVTTTTQCDVVAEGDKVTSQIWLRTPVGLRCSCQPSIELLTFSCFQALDKDLIDKVVQIQLQTKSHYQRPPTYADSGSLSSWSWFDLIVLESPEATQARVKDGLALIWFSHENKLGQEIDTEQRGPCLSKQDIFNSLEVSPG